MIFQKLRELSPAKRNVIRYVFFLPIYAYWVVILLSGMQRWPHSPIRNENGLYLNKKGNEFPESEYLAYLDWHTDPFVSWGGLLSFGVLLLVSWLVGIPCKISFRKYERIETSKDFRAFFPYFAGATFLFLTCLISFYTIF